MPAPPWLRDVLVVVGTAGVKALRQGVREGAAHAIDSVLEDAEKLTDEVRRRVKKTRKNIHKSEPEVIDADFEEE